MANYLLNEDGTFLLNEDASQILLEELIVSAISLIALLGVG
jgi:hypothetical protein